MLRALHIVDSIEYARSNCFQRQLTTSLHRLDNWQVTTVTPEQLRSINASSYDSIVSCLKQRSLFRLALTLGLQLDDQPIVVYDQDVWEAFRDGSPFKGSYDVIRQHLNVRTFAVTSQWWANWLNERNYPATFVKMWLLPELCADGPQQHQRAIELGFVGQLHPYRRELYDHMKGVGQEVTITGGLDYDAYLQQLSQIGIFVYRDEMAFTVDGQPHNLCHGLWGKAIEAAGRGCIVIRNSGDDADSYLYGLPSVRLYRDLAEVPSLIEGIRKLDVTERQSLTTQSVERIRTYDEWSRTARALVNSGLDAR